MKRLRCLQRSRGSSNQSASQIVETTARRAIAPRKFEPVWKWAERNVQLSLRTTNSPGRYDSEWMAYVRQWQEAFSDPMVREVVICSAAQSGKTESILNCLRWSIAEDPGPMLWIMPAESLARSFSETRLQPSLRDCPPCAGQIPDDPDQFKLLEMHFHDCTLNLVGANSPAQLSSRPVRYLFADEVDKFPESSAKEAGALELARVRTTSFWNSKTILTSTPTVESGQIWQAYLNGTRHVYYVACPHCRTKQQLVFAQLKWPENEQTKNGEKWNTPVVETFTYYECIHCRGRIEQSQKHEMVRTGEWKQTNTAASPDRISFHLSALYSPWRTWGSVAREFLEVNESVSGLQNFTNSVLAEPWKELQGEMISEARLLDLRCNYKVGTCPVKPAFVFVAADVQRDCVFFTVRAWSSTEESWLIDYGKLPTLESLDEVLAREYEIEGTTEKVKPLRGMIDSGYNTQAVYEYCSDSKGRYYPSKGWDNLAVPVKHAVVKFLPARGGIERNIRLYHFDDHAFKTDLYIRRIQDRKGPPFHLPHNVGSDYIQQLTAEQLVEKVNIRGIPAQTWNRVRKANHLGDCEKLQLVQAYLLGSHLKHKAVSVDTSAKAEATLVDESMQAEAPSAVQNRPAPKQGRYARPGFVGSWKRF